VNPGDVDRAMILWPLLGHLVLILALFVWLSFERARKVIGGSAAYRDLARPSSETGLAYRLSSNLSNQFEVPALFYPLVLALWATSQVDHVDVTLVWVFLGGRLLHTGVQTLTENVPLRGVVFSVNFLAAVALWAKFLWIALGS